MAAEIPLGRDLCALLPHLWHEAAGGESGARPTLYSVEIRAWTGLPKSCCSTRRPTSSCRPTPSCRSCSRPGIPTPALTYINLKIEKNGASVVGDELYDGHDHPAQQVKKSYKWSLKNYHFRPKETVTYWLEAQDNRHPEAEKIRPEPLRG